MAQNKKYKICALIGNGGRLKAIAQCCQNHSQADLVLAVSHKKESAGLLWAKGQGMEAISFRLSDWKAQGKERKDFDRELARILKERGIDLVVMAGWDLILSNVFLKEFPNAVINIHPSLCPSFPGLEAPKQALEYGAKITGCTLHFVPDEGVDTGPVIFQRAVELNNSDTLKSLEDKIHEQEEELLCEGIGAWVEGRIKVEGRIVKISPPPTF